MEWLVIAVIALWGYAYVTTKSKKTNKPKPAKEKQNPTVAQEGVDLHHWAPHKDYDHEFEVVGESNYQPNLERLAGDHGKQSPDLLKIAKLVPETDNEYDSSAVRVDIDGYTVGYMSRNDARGFRRRLSAKKLSGQTTACSAMIMGGYIDKTGKKTSYGVRLDMKPFE